MVEIEDQISGAEIDRDVAQLKNFHADDGIGLSGKVGIASQITHEHRYVGGPDGTELNFGYDGGLPRELPVEVETVS